MRSERRHQKGFSADPFHGRVRCSPMLGSFKNKRSNHARFFEGVAKSRFSLKAVVSKVHVRIDIRIKIFSPFLHSGVEPGPGEARPLPPGGGGPRGC